MAESDNTNGESFRSKLRAAHIAREDAKLSHTREKDTRRRTHRPHWSAFATDMTEYFGLHRKERSAFPEVDKLHERLADAIRDTHERGQKAIAVDFFGEASGKKLGFDTTIIVSLTAVPSDDASVVPVSGDIFAPSTVERFKKVLEETEGELLFFYCDPMGGMTAFRDSVEATGVQDNIYGITQLLKGFETAYERLSSKGYMVVDPIAIVGKAASYRFLDYLEHKGVVHRRIVGPLSSLIQVLIAKKPIDDIFSAS